MFKAEFAKLCIHFENICIEVRFFKSHIVRSCSHDMRSFTHFLTFPAELSETKRSQIVKFPQTK